jgi:asparagine synthase (glutamine-hydrolysing)
MCGIWALINSSYTTKDQLANYKELYDSINSRGPDKTNILHLNSNAYVFHRLAIHDLSPLGDQPFIFYANGSMYILICNGEIYNYKDLIKKHNFEFNLKSNSDCEVILHLFLKYRNINKVASELKGEFAFVLTEISNKSEITFVCRDPFGVRPLFYSYKLNEQIISYPNKIINKMFISSLLSGVVSLDVNKTKVFPPGKILTIIKSTCDLELTFSDYYKYEYHIGKNISGPNLYWEITSRLINAVKTRLDSDRPIGALLSGGLDSSLVCAIASKILGVSHLKTFSIGMKKGTDLEYAQLVASHLGCDHTEIFFTPEEGLQAIDYVLDTTETWDITTVRASVGQYLLGKYISSNTDIKVILNGDGADEVEMGYLYFYLAPDAFEAQKETEKLLKEIHRYDGLRVDRCISSHGLEARLPFLDVDFVDYYMEIDPELKIPTTTRMEKQLIRDAFSTLFPDLLPESVMFRKKEAFSDGVSSKEKSWFEIISEWIDTKVTDEEYTNRNVEKYGNCKSKESYYYRKRFNDKFNKTLNPVWDVIPHYWLPNWIETNGEPSARVLNVYK